MLRNAREVDAELVHNNFQQTHGETDFLLTYPDENSFNIEQEKVILLEKENSRSEIELCAFVDVYLVVRAGIEKAGSKDKVKHWAEVGISIAKSYWN